MNTRRDDYEEVFELDLLLDNPYEGEEIRKGETAERVKYGYSASALWNLGYHAAWYISSFARALKTPPALSLLDLTIELHEITEQNTRPLNPKSPQSTANWLEKTALSQKRVDRLWAKMYDEAFPKGKPHNLTEAQVAEVTETLETLLTKVELTAINGKATDKVILWKDFDHFVPNPTIVPEDMLAIHEQERALQGFSVFDTENPRAYLAWFLVQGCLYLASDKAHGYSSSVDSFCEWQIELLKFAKDVWADAFSDKDPVVTARALTRMHQLMFDLWD